MLLVVYSLQLMESCWECEATAFLQVVLQVAQARLLAAQQAPMQPKQPADPAAIPPPNRKK